jgi:ubiquinone/menaquinone biosynthesis C-methylase UbiE
MKDNKKVEKIRYDKKALELIANYGKNKKFIHSGIYGYPLELREPYIKYRELISQNLNSKMNVLELGCGVGQHTEDLLNTGAIVTATDISELSLDFLKLRYTSFSNLITKVADIEMLPFDDKSFDVVACAGSLSYGDYKKVASEINRVLKDEGIFICVDSLDVNPIYRINRFVKMLFRKNSLDVIRRIPNHRVIGHIGDLLNSSLRVEYYGAISWLMPLVSFVAGNECARDISLRADRLLKTKSSAFKFTLLARKNIKLNRPTHLVFFESECITYTGKNDVKLRILIPASYQDIKNYVIFLYYFLLNFFNHGFRSSLGKVYGLYFGDKRIGSVNLNYCPKSRLNLADYGIETPLEINISVFPDFQGLGFGFSAITMLLSELNHEKIIGIVRIDNNRSLHLFSLIFKNKKEALLIYKIFNNRYAILKP